MSDGGAEAALLCGGADPCSDTHCTPASWWKKSNWLIRLEEVRFLLEWKVVKRIAPFGGTVLKQLDSCGFWVGQMDRFVERGFAKSGALDSIVSMASHSVFNYGGLF